jgi:hypothetical protein
MRFFFPVLVSIVLGAQAYAQSEVQEPVITTTLCEIKAHPENFQHKLVQFTATASHGFEDSMVESDSCSWTKADAPGVWLEFGGRQSTDTMYCCGFTPKPDRPKDLEVDGMKISLVDDELFRKFNAALQAHPRPSKSVTVQATLRGRIFAKRVKLDEQSRGYWGGYGHMGCCMLFVVTQVVDVGRSGTRPD